METAKWYIYVLGLQDGKYYVGKTTNPAMTMHEHGTENGCEWTKIYKPEIILEMFEEDSYDEDSTDKIDETVKKYMSKYGIDHVRGGSYVTVALPRQDRALLQKEIRIAEQKEKEQKEDKEDKSTTQNKRRGSVVSGGEQLQIELTYPTSSNTLILVPCEEFSFIEDPDQIERAEDVPATPNPVPVTYLENILASTIVANTVRYVKSWF